ncbi:MAG: hypothetical protein ACFFCQ_14045 [Promethearchaeota archaeon]
MAEWKPFLRVEPPIDWLLEEKNPAIRYFTLRDLLKIPQTSPFLDSARKEIHNESAIQKILQYQYEDGGWEEERPALRQITIRKGRRICPTCKQPIKEQLSSTPRHDDQRESWLLPKHRSTFWQLCILGQIGANIENKQIYKACERAFLFQDPKGNFTHVEGETTSSGLGGTISGLVVCALLRMGWEYDANLWKATESLVNSTKSVGGWLYQAQQSTFEQPDTRISRIIFPLEAFVERPQEQWTQKTATLVAESVEFLFRFLHHLANSEEYMQLSFPYLQQFDLLRFLILLVKLGYQDDKRVLDAWKTIAARQQEDGVWILEKTASNMLTSLGSKRRANKWITLNALRVARSLFGAEAIPRPTSLENYE